MLQEKEDGRRIHQYNQIYPPAFVAFIEQGSQGLTLLCITETGKIQVFGKELHAEAGIMVEHIANTIFNQFSGREIVGHGIKDDHSFFLDSGQSWQR